MDSPTIVLGLGNPGTRYRRTRHNLGFRVVERLAERRGASFEARGELAGKAWTAEISTASGPLVLAKPRTYMNRSGRAAVALCRHYTALPRQLLVVYDDADLPLGRIRIRPEGSAGGHRGLVSLIDALQSEEFPRVRLGVRGQEREERELSDYVLAPFEPEEEKIADSLVALAADAVDAVLVSGVEIAMNRFNGRDAAAPDSSEPEEDE